MTRQRVLAISAAAALVLVAGALLAIEQLVPPRRAEPQQVDAPPPATPHVTATLFFASPDGQKLQPVRREVPLADALGVQILIAQLAPPPPPYVSVIPKGTTLRAFYTTDRGDAFVDVSAQVSSAHTGGSTAELLTVYAIVNAVAVNLPSVRRVQILVDGKEVDTLAGHVDLRRPLARDASLVKEQ
jgi:spore germination protein GerM